MLDHYLDHAVIHMLSRIAKKLSDRAGHGYQTDKDIKTIHDCCNRIAHIGQYLLEQMDTEKRREMLMGDLQFIKEIIKRYPEKNSYSVGYWPTINDVAAIEATAGIAAGKPDHGSSAASNTCANHALCDAG